MKTALITGASGEIGRAIAVAFARRGYSLALCYLHNETGALNTLSAARDMGAAAKIFQGDVCKPDDVDRLFRGAETKLGPVEILINNAGLSHFGLFSDLSHADWARIIDTNLTSVFLCCKRALPSMIQQKSGSIVNISSVWGEVGAACEVAYSAAKAGVIGLTRALAKEEGPSGIRVNCIAPGFIDTKMNAAFTQTDIDSFAEQTPLCRIGTPDEVAQAVLFLSEQTFITGQILGVNGGIN